MSMNYGPEIIQYTIQTGDSLWDLADRYNTTAEAIIAGNPGMDPDNLYVGEVISIPDDQQPMSAEQFRRFGPGFGRPFIRPGSGAFGPPFRRFGPFFRGPVVLPVPYPVYPCPPYDPYCYYPY
jgi:hypothetical protein